jgi:hypothetical protein
LNVTKPQTTDWFRVLWDLIQRGYNLAAIERATGISSSTLRGYQEGSHPPHWRGELLADVWVEVVGPEPAGARLTADERALLDHLGGTAWLRQQLRRATMPTADLVLAPRVVHEEPQVVADPAAVRRLEQAWRA